MSGLTSRAGPAGTALAGLDKGGLAAAAGIAAVTVALADDFHSFVYYSILVPAKTGNMGAF
jgi:hypothetical protein